MSSPSLEAARDAAITPKLIAVKEALATWARGSTDGAKVWEVANEILPDMWHDWNLYLRSDAVGAVLPNVTACLQDIAVAVDDQAVAEAVASARSAIALYREAP